MRGAVEGGEGKGKEGLPAGPAAGLSPPATAPALAPWEAPTPSVAISALESKEVDPSSGTEMGAVRARERIGTGNVPPCLPMLVSECPGWVCFAEKSSPQSLPYLARTRSPQQVLGLAVLRATAHTGPSSTSASSASSSSAGSSSAGSSNAGSSSATPPRAFYHVSI